MDSYLILWVIFSIIAVFVFFLDFKLSISKPHIISLRESLMLCLLWVIIATIYGFIIGYFLGSGKMVEYFTAYIVEYSLSVDNMFVFLMIFSFFNIKPQYQPRVLLIGILSAVVMRMIFIFTGIALINKFAWIIYIFGLVLIYTGIKMFLNTEEKIEPDKNFLLKLLQRYISIEMKYEGEKFFIRKNTKIVPTVMLAVLIVIESSDIVFAIDSIPAVLAISTDKLIVYSSNIFAVIGLRSLYFFLSSISNYFVFLKKGVGVVLIYVGIKMLISRYIHISSIFSLILIISILSISILLSVLVRKK